MMTTSGTRSPSARTVTRKEPFTALDAPQKMREVTVPEKTKDDWRSSAERIAQHRLYRRNEHMPLLKEAFPALRHMWHVNKLFPFANGGVLAVDEPNIQAEIQESRQKAEILRAAGIRMVVIEPCMSFQEIQQQLVQEEQT